MSNQLIALMRHGAICLALGLTFSAAAFAQTPVARQTAQAQLSPAESESKPIRDGKAEMDKEDAPSLLEEMRRMRQLIERLEARISQLEAERAPPFSPARTLQF